MLFLTKLFGKAACKLYEGFVPAAGSFMHNLGRVVGCAIMLFVGYQLGCVLRGIVVGVVAVVQAVG